MKKLTYFIVAALSVVGIMTSCGDDYEYSPGEAVADNCPIAYFSSDNESEIFVTSDGEKSFTLKVNRENTTEAITIPIIVDSKKGSFNIPESVSFAAGESEALLTITYDEFEGGMNFSIHLDDDYVNPYLEVDGSVYYKASLAQLTKVADVTYASDTRFAGVTSSAIYAYSGENKFRWSNFMGSGVNLTFTVDTSHSGGVYDPSNFKNLYGDIVPLSYFKQDDYGYHFVKEVGSEDYVTWTPEGASEAITSFYFYGYYSSSSYSYIDFGYGGTGYDGYGYFWSSYVNDANYENIYFYLHY